MEFEPVIGIEVHAQLKTKTKLFCGCPNGFGDHPNVNVCPVCLGMPGALPVLNQEAVDLAIKAGLALNCEIQEASVFARKNYFYPDLPKGYQISQFELPICLKGHLKIQVDGEEKTIGITRIHMEEDAGKLLHQGAESIAGSSHSHVDLNRACVPLIEIVSEPDIRSAEEAKAYMESLKHIVQFTDVCDGNLEEGSLRADANVSLRLKGDTAFGIRAEIKNLNSFRSLERAINYEIKRQAELLRSGGVVIQETRHYDDFTGKTSSLRGKEDSHDYRYFPDPDLKPLLVSQERVSEIQKNMTELPDQIITRYQETLSLPDGDIKVLVSDKLIYTYYEDVLKKEPDLDPKEVAKWLVGDFMAYTKEHDKTFETPPIDVAKFVDLLLLLKSGKISGKMGKEILGTVFSTGESPSQILKKSGGEQISDETVLQDVVAQIVSANLDVVAKVKAGKTKSADFLMGQVMKETKGRAKPDLVRKLILEDIQNR